MRKSSFSRKRLEPVREDPAEALGQAKGRQGHNRQHDELQGGRRSCPAGCAELWIDRNPWCGKTGGKIKPGRLGGRGRGKAHSSAIN